MKRFAIIFFFIPFISQLQAQSYLVKDSVWQQKIKENYFLAPLFYGVTRNSHQLDSENLLRQQLITKYGNSTEAHREQLITGWNYLFIGAIDSSVIHFNEAFLLDSNNLEAAFAFSTIIKLIDFNNNQYNRDPNRYSDLAIYLYNIHKIYPPWRDEDFNGNDTLVYGLMNLFSNQQYIPILAQVLLHPQLPYKVDSAEYLLVKIKGISEGFYKMGRKADGEWIDYIDGVAGIIYLSRAGNDHRYPEVFFGKDTSKIYSILNGIEIGRIVDYGYEGKPRAIYYKDSVGKISGPCEIFDDSGALVRTEYWHNDTLNKAATKVIRDWNENGTVESGMLDGHLRKYQWKDSKKILTDETPFGTWDYEEAGFTLNEDSTFLFMNYLTHYRTYGRFWIEGDCFVLKDYQDRDSIRYSIDPKTLKRKPLPQKLYRKNTNTLFDEHNEAHLSYNWLGIDFKEGNIILTKADKKMLRIIKKMTAGY
jgi:hypothetical protein